MQSLYPYFSQVARVYRKRELARRNGKWFWFRAWTRWLVKHDVSHSL